MYVDMPEPQLREYRSSQTAPDDFDSFWESTLQESRAASGTVSVVPVDTGLVTVDVFDVAFPGYAGQPVRGWLRMPRERSGPLPAVVQYVGYGGGRGRSIENLLWASAGFAHLLMDTRGQGSFWSAGDTPDEAGAGPQIPGFMTRGITSKETYYYRRLITDAVRAVDAVRTLPEIDATRVAVHGGSQGGGLSLAVGGLVDDLAAVVPYVPFLCDFPRAITIHDNDPYREIVRYLAVHREQVDQVQGTLSYFDGVNFAARANAPAWFSAALMDETCKPSTVFAAFNAYAGPKEIDVWPFNNHEGGAVDSDARTLAVLTRRFAEMGAGSARRA
ncbi:acetylxylan esterase [Herbiconiux sp. L3-i23]|uniref:acetylxylan esterase n=1 Tax=Herbiconiux sp. L3-i23 TaxID=2905871 RepID=UPI00205E0942|nr:acetylxylan esterase [Herbiconiux sp. L3-i23]BDI21379.1 acetylxylan esterase [Herbiconiux sp. L3-i23]